MHPAHLQSFSTLCLVCVSPFSTSADDWHLSGLFLAIVKTSSGFRSSCYWMDWNRATTENIRIGLVFVVLAHWKFLYCIDKFDNIKANISRFINNKFYSTILVFVFLFRKNDVNCNSVGHFDLFLNIACIMNQNGVTKKTDSQNKIRWNYFITTKSSKEKHYYLSKNNKTKQTKQLHITWNNFFEIHHFSKGEVILHYFSYNEIRSRVPWTSLSTNSTVYLSVCTLF